MVLLCIGGMDISGKRNRAGRPATSPISRAGGSLRSEPACKKDKQPLASGANIQHEDAIHACPGAGAKSSARLFLFICADR